MNTAMCAASRQRGASLIELMVAMVIGLVILLAVSEVFVNNNRIRGEVERTGRQIENGVFALQMLEDDLSNAGFWGETTVAAGGTVPPVCPTDDDLDDLTDAMGYPVQPGDGTCDGAIANIKAGSESLAIRRASTCALGTPNCQAVNAALHYVQVESCDKAGDVGEGQLALGAAGLTNQARDCITPAPIYRYLSRLYYVTGDDELARMEMGTAADYESSGPLVDGIEALHSSFGIDGDGDGVVDSYTDAPTNAQLGNVIAVRFWVVARNLQPTQGYTDEREYQLGDLEYDVPAAFVNHKRQVYSTVVALRNVAGAREVQ